MANKKNVTVDYVKKPTMLVAVFITFVLGFLTGAVFAVYKMPPGAPVPGMAGMQTPHETHAEPSMRPSVPKDLSDQIVSYEKQTAETPDDAEAWGHLGNLYFDANHFEKAIGAYKRSLALKPDNPEILTDMGVMYRRAGNFQEAIRAFERAIEIDSGFQIARFNKGIVLMHDLNDLEGAVKEWEKLVEINPNATTPGGQSIASMIERFHNNK